MHIKKKNILNRRNFLKYSSLGSVLLTTKPNEVIAAHGENQKDNEFSQIKEYRTLGRTGFKVSDIGRGRDSRHEPGILNALIKAGVNYIDTAEIYGDGRDEEMIGQCIKNFDRKSLFLTTKIHPKYPWKTTEEFVNRFRKSLARLKTDYVDCLMLQAASSSELVKDKAFHSAIAQLKNEGRVRFCGIACHGSALYNEPTKETMEQILMTAVNDGRYEVVLLAYNFLQKNMGNRVLKACKNKNIGTVIMKSVPYSRFSQLQELSKKRFLNLDVDDWVKNQSEKVDQFKNQFDVFCEKHQLSNRSNKEEIRDAAIRFVINNKNVDSLLISFSTFDDINSCLKLSGSPMNSSDAKSLKDFKETMGPFYCRHACGLCESSCPHHVPINTIMRYDHYFLAQHREKYAMERYARLTGNKADLCDNCEGFCEKDCPYHVQIQSLLTLAHRNMTISC